MLLRRKI